MRRRIILGAGLLGVLALAAVAHYGSSARQAYAQSALAEYAIDWYTIDSGGALNSSGGTYALSGTIGQHDAGSTMESGTYDLKGGFWPGAQARYIIAVPIASR
ncbi:MAG TPA: hypothetical protein VGD69_30690 [Herpetosiphonaceae bacterium]